MLAKRIALGFGIALVFPLLIHYGVSTLITQPKWEDYQIENYYEQHQRATPEEQKKMEIEKSKLDKKWKETNNRFTKHLYFVAVPLGIIALIAGAFLSTQAIGTGLMFGGIFSISNGYYHYWYELPDPLKFASMLLAFIVLLFIGYKKLDNKT